MRDALQEMTRRETAAEVLCLLKPGEREVVVLRLRGLNDRQIGERLGIGRAAVSMRMVRARRRIAQCVPDVAGLLGGRRRLGDAESGGRGKWAMRSEREKETGRKGEGKP